MLQAHLPEAIRRELRWSSLKWQSASFIDDRLRDSESDLLYEIKRKADGAPAWLYLLLEHQSTPDAWLRLRLLKYSIRIWERDRQRHPDEEQLRPIVPVVLYQGARGWRHAREVLGAVCRVRAELAGSAAVRAPVDRPDEGGAGRGVRRAARAHRATGDDGGVPCELARV